MAGSVRSGSHGQTAGVNAGVAENNGVGSGEFLRQLRQGKGAGCHLRSEPGGAYSVSCAGEELAAPYFSGLHLAELHCGPPAISLDVRNGAEGSLFRRKKYKPVSGTLLHGRGRPFLCNISSRATHEQVITA